MPTIKNIYVLYEQGMDVLAPHLKDALGEMMDCFPEFKANYPIKILGNWSNGRGHHESVEWYIKTAQLRSQQEGRFQRTGQISIEQLADDFISDPYTKTIPQWQILVTKKDLYARGLNYCLGYSQENAFSIVSTARFIKGNEFDLEGFKTVLMHEFGHCIGLAKEGRAHTEENLGSHCTNTGCIMQQRADGDFRDLTRFRLEAKRLYGLPPICGDCIKDGKKFFTRQQIIYNHTHGLDTFYGISR
ncbi:MAG: hypothetical protein IJ870_00785 [Alphaproteobacteria bacterium]|nr:hypothetical protein [Alphaproteobacteria bacterium]